MTTTPMDWEWLPDELEFTLGTNGVGGVTRARDVAAGTPISAADHNAIVAQLAIARDVIARPRAAGFASMFAAGGTQLGSLSGATYLPVTYHGPVTAQGGTQVPVFGTFPPDGLAGDALLTYKAITQLCRRLAGYTESGTIAGGGVGADRALAGFYGAPAEAVIPLRGNALPTFGVTEDPGIRGAFAVLFAGLGTFVMQSAEAAWLGHIVTQGAEFATARPVVAQLAKEYDDEQKGARTRGALIGVGLLAAGVGARLAIKKKSFWQPFR